MASTTEKFITTTCQLLETQGYHATGMNQIIQESGAPRGSLYYHFPGGKQELAERAVQQAGDNTAALISDNLDTEESLADGVREFVLGVAEQVEHSDYKSGSPLTATAMETANTNPDLNQACREAFSRIREAIGAKISRTGVPPEEVNALATFITAAIEGGIILSRTHHSPEPLQAVTDHMAAYLKTPGPGSTAQHASGNSET